MNVSIVPPVTLQGIREVSEVERSKPHQRFRHEMFRLTREPLDVGEQHGDRPPFRREPAIGPGFDQAPHDILRHLGTEEAGRVLHPVHGDGKAFDLDHARLHDDGSGEIEGADAVGLACERA